MPDAFPFYRKRQFPSLKRKSQHEMFRGSARERGYDTRWDRLSASFRRQHPTCLFCDQNDRAVLCDDVDHMVPIEDGGAVHDVANLISLCRGCHAGLKRSMQQYARETGQVSKLVDWCLRPETRPEQFRRR